VLLAIALASSLAKSDPDCSEESIKEARASSYDFHSVLYCEAQNLSIERIEYMHAAFSSAKYASRVIEDKYGHANVCEPEQDIARLAQLGQLLERVAETECALANNVWWPGDKTVSPTRASCLHYAPVTAFNKLKAIRESSDRECMPLSDAWMEDENAFSPSFSCTSATNEVEEIICSSRRLSILDAYMSVLYKYITSGRGGVGENEAGRIRQEQRNWLARRERGFAACRNCDAFLENEYTSRIEELQEIFTALTIH